MQQIASGLEAEVGGASQIASGLGAGVAEVLQIASGLLAGVAEVPRIVAGSYAGDAEASRIASRLIAGVAEVSRIASRFGGGAGAGARRKSAGANQARRARSIRRNTPAAGTTRTALQHCRNWGRRSSFRYTSPNYITDQPNSAYQAYGRVAFSVPLGRFGWFSVRTVEKYVPFCTRPAKVPQIASGLGAEVAEV